MKHNSALAEEYLEEAELLRRHIRAAKAEPGPDLSGRRARRIRLLTEMYLECRTVGHVLQHRGGAA